MTDHGNDTKQYTLADIERYLQGKLLPAEMHAMEKTALSDPFLADAIEGFRSTDTDIAKKDLANIRRSLLEKEETKRIIPSAVNTRWMRVAALFIVLASVGTFSWYLVNNGNDKRELAQEALTSTVKDSAADKTAAAPQRLPLPTTPEAVRQNIQHKKSGDLVARTEASKLRAESERIVAMRETSAAAAKLITQEPVNKETLTAANQPNQQMASASANITHLGGLTNLTVSGSISVSAFSGTLTTANQPNITTVSTLDRSLLASTVPTASLNSITSIGQLSNLSVSGMLSGKMPGVSIDPSAKNYTDGTIRIRGSATPPPKSNLQVFKGHIVDPGGKPVAGASVTVNNQKTVTTDREGNFYFLSQDSLLNIQVMAVGFDTKQLQLSKEKTTNVILNPTTQSLSEVVVTGYSKERKQSVTGSVQLQKDAESQAISPKNGWSLFKADLADKLAAARAKNMTGAITGTIELELDLNRKGTVKNVTVIRSFNTTLNPTFIQALKDGPVWLDTNGKPARGKRKITIQL